jgi:hypothetical protein
VNQADAFKKQIAELGGWAAARKANPELVAKAEVYGVTPPKEEKAEKVLDRDKPPSAQEMIDATLAHVTKQKESAAAIEAKLLSERVPAEKAHAIAVRISGMDPDERKASIKFIQGMYGKKNPVVADSLIADWSQPGDFESPAGTGSPLDNADLGTATAKQGGQPAAPTKAPIAAEAAPTSIPGMGQPAGEVSKEREMSLYEKERELDMILQKLREELGQ